MVEKSVCESYSVKVGRFFLCVVANVGIRVVAVLQYIIKMARSMETLSIYEAKDMLEERLTCQSCSNILEEPRVLSCMHSFCYSCVEDFDVEEGDDQNFFKCPFCSTLTVFPEDGAAALPPAFHLIAMLELYKMVKKVQDGDKTSCENCHANCAVGYCKHCSQLLCRGCITIHRRWSKFESHNILGIEEIADTAFQRIPLKEPGVVTCSEHNEPSSFECNTCESLICQSCTVHSHKEHDFQLISETFPAHQDEITSTLLPLKEQMGKINEALAEINERETEILRQGDEVMSSVEQFVQTVLETVKQAEEDLYSSVQTVAQEKTAALSEQKAELEANFADLQRCEMHVEEEMRIASPQQILLNKKQMIEMIQSATSKAVVENMSPKEIANISVAPTEDLLEKCQDIAKVASAEIAGIQMLGKSSAFAVVGKTKQFDIRIKTNPLGYLIVPTSIVCSFASSAEEVITCEVEELAPAKYRVNYTPPDQESRQLKVVINESMHFDIPFTVNVLPIPELRRQLKSGVAKPWGICINKADEVIVTDYEAHQIRVLNKQGNQIRTIGKRGKGKGQLRNPAGIAINHENQLVVVECVNHRVQILSEDGNFVKCVGEKGEMPLQFNFPYDVAISKSGLMYISDSYNHRIQVLNANLNLAGVFGSEGTGPGQFKNPIGIAIDHADRVYIADSGNERIQVFNLAGDYEREFGQEVLTIPTGVAVDSNDVVYVTDAGVGQIAMFDDSGDHLGSYENPSNSTKEFSRPTGITVSTTQVIYACDWGVNDVFTFY